MEIRQRRYPCSKPLALASLYDTLEKLKWRLISSNSDAGILIALDRKTAAQFLIRVSAEQRDEVAVTVEQASVCPNRKQADLSALGLLEALDEMIRSALESAFITWKGEDGK